MSLQDDQRLCPTIPGNRDEIPGLGDLGDSLILSTFEKVGAPGVGGGGYLGDLKSGMMGQSGFVGWRCQFLRGKV